MPSELLTQDEAVSALLKYLAALEDDEIDGPSGPINRYLIKVDRQLREIYLPKPIVLSETEFLEVILAATGHHLASSIRYIDGAFSISYKITVRECSDSYVVQLRHHGSVESMDLFMTLVSKTVDSRVLPIPPTYPIPGERKRQKATGMGKQITRFIPGVMASSVYPQLSHEERLIFQIQLPETHLIGELIAEPATTDDRVILKIKPDRYHGLGGPFHSVRDYLRAYIRSCLLALEKQQGIEAYKERFLKRIKTFVDNHMHIPAIVEDIPIVTMHADMGLHNIIVSSQNYTEIQGVIDWEFLSSAPYASLYRIIETLFRKRALNGFGLEYDRAHELREAFWGAIPDWGQWNRSEATQVFLEWFKFGLFMKPEWMPKNLSENEKQQFWGENIR
ncbi:uncharacterized protein F4812DRAFT_452934 [Daldinia caldariorum]|uniref:uncharacterized protein n=1 Tax=Daldinia caldariorum TaxID=326644 RepID=UPI0020072D95|nr:uncharacterized protein F4812DRAFT_452934 [Daldinia caldariorum]KAI1464284.1 hypothetical protein F4812DRAFT_452934 [Daldinia caldariorum]